MWSDDKAAWVCFLSHFLSHFNWKQVKELVWKNKNIMEYMLFVFHVTSVA